MMKLKWTSSNKNIIKFLISLLIIGILTGIYIYLKQPSLVKASIISELGLLGTTLKSGHQNNFIFHILLLSVITILTMIVLGLPLVLFYLFYEGVSLGFLLAGFIHYKNISGLLYGVIFLAINKLLLYIGLIYLLISSINYSKKVLVSIKNKDYKLREYIFNYLIKTLFVFSVILIYDIFIYFFGNKILSYFLFLL